MVKPVVVCGSEKRAVAEMDMERLGTWERRIIRRILEQWQRKEFGE
jgi:hypothetical protein